MSTRDHPLPALRFPSRLSLWLLHPDPADIASVHLLTTRPAGSSRKFHPHRWHRMTLRRTPAKTGQTSDRPERFTGAIWEPLRGYVFRPKCHICTLTGWVQIPQRGWNRLTQSGGFPGCASPRWTNQTSQVSKVFFNFLRSRKPFGGMDLR